MKNRSEIKIKSAGLDELEVLMEWRLRVLHEVFELSADADLAALERANRAYYQQALTDGRHLACLALAETPGPAVQKRGAPQVIGCGGLVMYREMPSPDNPAGQCAYLMNIYVLPEYRRHGGGRKIVDWLVAQAQARGITKIYLESTPAGQPLYRSAGFRKMGGMMVLGETPNAN